MRLLVIAPPAFGPLELLRQQVPDVELSVGTDVEVLRNEAGTADAVLVAPRYGGVLRALWPALQNVRWVHTLAAGVEFLPFDLLRSSEVIITSSRGLYANALAEFAIAAMLWFAKDLRRLMRNQEAHRWEPYTVGALDGQSVGVIGYGGIGQAVGRRASSFGMRVLPFRRKREPGDPAMEEVLSQSDYVVMSTPLTPNTDKLLSRVRIATMKPSAVFINIGRGGTVDEEALLDALRNHTIRGAALDVFEVEPLPPDHPFWQLENILISPHTADHTFDAHLRAMHFFLANLRRFRAGEALENIVDKIEQY